MVVPRGDSEDEDELTNPLDQSRYHESPDPLREWKKEDRRKRAEEDRARFEQERDRGQSLFYVTDQKGDQSCRNYMCELTRLHIDGWGKKGDPQTIKDQFMRGLNDERVAKVMTDQISRGVLEDMSNEEILTTAVAVRHNLEKQEAGGRQTRMEVQLQGRKELEEIVRNKIVSRQKLTMQGGAWGGAVDRPEDECEKESRVRYPSEERWKKNNPALCRGCAKPGHFIGNCNNPFLMRSKIHVAKMKKIFGFLTEEEIWEQGRVPQDIAVRPGEARVNVNCYKCGTPGHYASRCWTRNADTAAGDRARERDETERGLRVNTSSTSIPRPARTDGSIERKVQPDTDEATRTLLALKESLDTLVQRSAQTAHRVIQRPRMVLDRRVATNLTVSPPKRPRSPTPERGTSVDERRFWPHRPRTAQEDREYNEVMQRRLHPGRDREEKEDREEREARERRGVREDEEEDDMPDLVSIGDSASGN
jgi:hypothetical protein